MATERSPPGAPSSLPAMPSVSTSALSSPALRLKSKRRNSWNSKIRNNPIPILVLVASWSNWAFPTRNTCTHHQTKGIHRMALSLRGSRIQHSTTSEANGQEVFLKTRSWTADVPRQLKMWSPLSCKLVDNPHSCKGAHCVQYPSSIPSSWRLRANMNCKSAFRCWRRAVWNPWNPPFGNLTWNWCNI